MRDTYDIGWTGVVTYVLAAIAIVGPWLVGAAVLVVITYERGW